MGENTKIEWALGLNEKPGIYRNGPGIHRSGGDVVIIASTNEQILDYMSLLDYASLRDGSIKRAIVKLSPLTEEIIADVFNADDWPDWVIVEGGDKPMHPEWVRSIRDQCVAAGIPFYFAGWGKADAGRVLDGRTWDERPG